MASLGAESTNDSPNVKENVTFEHFLKVTGCKMLITLLLKYTLKNLLVEPFTSGNQNFLTRNKKKKNSKSQNDHASDSVLKNPENPTAEGEKPEGNNIYNNILISNNKVSVSSTFLFGFCLEKPEFNLYNLNYSTQLLAASKNCCRVYVTKDILPYDDFQRDPKYMIRLCFND